MKKSSPSKRKQLEEYNRELKKVRHEHPRLPIWGARIVVSDHMKLKKNKRD